MAETSIDLHPQHGLNATIPMCFWCTKAKGGITPLGNTIEGAAPPQSVLDYMPCESCKRLMQAGLTLIEVASAEELKRPAILGIAAPTGRWFVCPLEEAEKVFDFFKLTAHHRIPVLTHRRMLLEVGLYEKIIPKSDGPKDATKGAENDQDHKLRVGKRRGAQRPKRDAHTRLPKASKPS